ncbi:UNVERIFIED_CONTAM: hypothetical protein GTU68_043346 [Idotea baltica]|nr:hypothetical protein [Idotea baltica]
MRARMALYYAGVTCELREVVLKNKPQEMLAVSAKGTVPVLLLKEQVIDESLDVMRWALQQNDPDEWSDVNLDDSLIARNDDYFKFYLDRYKYFDRYPEKDQEYYLQQACVFINELETAIAISNEGSAWLNGDSLSSVDVAVFPFVRQFAFVDKNVFNQLPYPKVQQWLALLLDSDLFQSVMLKYPAWQDGQQTVFFPNKELIEATL